MRKGLTFGGRCLVADEMGLGKTVQVRLRLPLHLFWYCCHFCIDSAAAYITFACGRWPWKAGMLLLS